MRAGTRTVGPRNDHRASGPPPPRVNGAFGVASDGLRPPLTRASARLLCPLSVWRLAVSPPAPQPAEVPTAVRSPLPAGSGAAQPCMESRRSGLCKAAWRTIGSRGSLVRIQSPRPSPTCMNTVLCRWASPREGPLQLQLRFWATSPSLPDRIEHGNHEIHDGRT